MFWLAVSAGMAYILMLSSKDLITYNIVRQHKYRFTAQIYRRRVHRDVDIDIPLHQHASPGLG